MSNGWMVSGMSTAAAAIAEKASNSPQQTLELSGFWLMSNSSVSATTAAYMLQYGESSGSALSSTPLALDPGSVNGPVVLSVSGLKIKAKYFALASPTTHATGVTAGLFGEYG